MDKILEMLKKRPQCMVSIGMDESCDAVLVTVMNLQKRAHITGRVPLPLLKQTRLKLIEMEIDHLFKVLDEAQDED